MKQTFFLKLFSFRLSDLCKKISEHIALAKSKADEFESPFQNQKEFMIKCIDKLLACSELFRNEGIRKHFGPTFDHQQSPIINRMNLINSQEESERNRRQFNKRLQSFKEMM